MVIITFYIEVNIERKNSNFTSSNIAHFSEELRKIRNKLIFKIIRLSRVSLDGRQGKRKALSGCCTSVLRHDKA